VDVTYEQVVHGLKQKILKLEGQLRDKEAAVRFVIDADNKLTLERRRFDIRKTT